MRSVFPSALVAALVGGVVSGLLVALIGGAGDPSIGPDELGERLADIEAKLDAVADIVGAQTHAATARALSIKDRLRERLTQGRQERDKEKVPTEMAKIRAAQSTLAERVAKRVRYSSYGLSGRQTDEVTEIGSAYAKKKSEVLLRILESLQSDDDFEIESAKETLSELDAETQQRLEAVVGADIAVALLDKLGYVVRAPFFLRRAATEPL